MPVRQKGITDTLVCVNGRVTQIGNLLEAGIVNPGINSGLNILLHQEMYIHASSLATGLLLLEDRVKPLSLRTAKLVFGHVRHVTYDCSRPCAVGVPRQLVGRGERMGSMLF